MRGFVIGSLALVAAYALLQKGAADKVSSGSGVLVNLFQRLLSPQVAGVPDRAGASSTTSSTGTAAKPAATPAPQQPTVPSFITV